MSTAAVTNTTAASVASAMTSEALYAVDDYIDESPYKAYKNCISYVTRTMEESQEDMPMTFAPWILVGLVVALIYAAVNLHQNKAKDTTTTNQYVDGKKPKINDVDSQLPFCPS